MIFNVGQYFILNLVLAVAFGIAVQAWGQAILDK